MQKGSQDIKLLLLLLLTVSFLNNSCQRSNSFPNEPAIEYQSYSLMQDISGKDSLVLLKFGFTDGDGDIGFTQQDTVGPFHSGSKFYFNIFINYFEMQSGGDFHQVSIPFSNDTINFNQRMPVITPEGKNKAVKGTIEVKIPTSVYQLVPERIKFKIRLVDRKLNVSNEIETEEISVNL